MRKTFPLTAKNHKPERVLDAIKHDVRKYIKRERKRTLPEGKDFWDFDCRVGVDEASAKGAHVSELAKAVDAAAKEASESIYVEILAKAAARTRKPSARKPSADRSL